MGVNKICCIEKVRNTSGLIVDYVMQDEFGNTYNLGRKELARVLKNKQYNVVNLQLDSMGRIVDKAVSTDKLTELEVRLTNGLNLVQKMNDTEYMSKINIACKNLKDKGYMFTHVYSRKQGNTKFNYIIFYRKEELITVDRKIYTAIEKMVKSYSSVSEAVQDLEMKDTRFGIVDLLDDAIIHAFGDEEKVQKYIKQQIDNSGFSDLSRLINYIFKDINQNRLYDYDGFKRRCNYTEFNNQLKKVLKNNKTAKKPKTTTSGAGRGIINYFIRRGARRTAIWSIMDLFSRK